MHTTNSSGGFSLAPSEGEKVGVGLRAVVYPTVLSVITGAAGCFDYFCSPLQNRSIRSKPFSMFAMLVA